MVSSNFFFSDNLSTIVWFKVFLSDIIDIYIIIWFQVTIPI